MLETIVVSLDTLGAGGDGPQCHPRLKERLVSRPDRRDLPQVVHEGHVVEPVLLGPLGMISDLREDPLRAIGS